MGSLEINSEIAALLEETPSDPKVIFDGIPLNEMQEPTCSVRAPLRSSLKPALIKRCDIDPKPLLNLLEKEGAAAWDPIVQSETNVPFDRPAHDRWGVGKIMLIHCDDFMKRCYHMPWWHERTEWRDVIEPYFKALGVPTNRIVRCLLASLPPGVVIPVHHDTGHWVPRTHRLHVPVITNKNVLFRAGYTEPLMERYQLEVGGIYELNNQSKHYVSNWGEECRVHLIFDYIEPDTPTPTLEILDRGEAVLQTRRSIDRVKHAGSRPVGPAFIILGAQKSGTTALYEYLHQHPLVMKGSRRESHAFDWRWEDRAKTVEEKRRFCINRFFDAKKLHSFPSIMCGDSTPSYLLHSNVVIDRMKEVVPWVKLLVCMRDPVLRAYSHYQMVIDPNGTQAQLATRGQSQWINKTFAQVVDEELAILESLNITSETSYAEFSSKYLSNPKLCPLGHGGHSLVARGLYALQLEPWLDAFPLSPHKPNNPPSTPIESPSAAENENENELHPLASQPQDGCSNGPSLMVVRLEDLNGNTKETMGKVFDHIGLEHVELEDDTPKNARAYDPLNESSCGAGSGSDEEAAMRLRAYYHGHNARLGSLLGDSTFTEKWVPKQHVSTTNQE